jgi:hypothetical protein
MLLGNGILTALNVVDADLIKLFELFFFFFFAATFLFHHNSLFSVNLIASKEGIWV